MADRYAVIGNPVAHSKSPWIHAKFAAQTGEAIEYGAILAPRHGFAAAIAAFQAAGGKGANVTLPFKEDAFAICMELSGRARTANAVNTLMFSNLRVIGDNTDGCGLTRDLALNLGFVVEGRRILLLGAGGAARGVLAPLLAERPEGLTLSNRSLDKARALVALLPADLGRNASVCSYEDLRGRTFDLVINATSAGLSDASLPLPSGIFSAASLAYDMMYGRETLFMRQARAGGAARISDGVGMLVEQAAESFFLWRGIRPLTAPVLTELRLA